MKFWKYILKHTQTISSLWTYIESLILLSIFFKLKESIEVKGNQIIEFTLPKNELEYEIELEITDSNGIKSNKRFPIVLQTSEVR